MNAEQLEIVKEYIQLGFPVFPCNSDKTPMCKWLEYESRIDDFENAEYVGLRMGGKHKLFAIDFDLKNCSDERLMQKYSALVDKNIIDKVIAAETKNGGFHFLFSVDNPDNNRKYALSSKDETIIESRGTGGYIIIAPSEGYSFRKGKSLRDVQRLNDDEFAILTSVASMFDQSLYKRLYQAPVPEATYHRSSENDGRLTPWEDFSRNVDFLEMMKGYGWTVFREKGERVFLTRPGKSTGISGDWHKGYNLFKCWSSNVPELEQQVAYSPFSVYTLYEHGADKNCFSLSAKKLYEEGWGDRLTKEEEVILDIDNPLNFVIQESAIKKDLMDYYDGRIEYGKSTGSYGVDKYFRFKNNEFVQIVGHSNVGKTFFFKYLMAMGIQFNGMKFLVAATENRAWDFIDDMASFILCMRAAKAKIDHREELNSVVKLITDSVTFLKPSDKSIFDILEVAKGLCKEGKKKKYDAFLIDPLNGFMIDHKIKGEGASYHTQCASALLSFAGEFCSIYLNTHTIVGSQRNYKDLNTGKRKVPNKSDAEFGGNYGNKADTIIIIDRDIDSEEEGDKLITKMWVKKIRTQKLGGKYNSDSNPIKFTFNHNSYGFDIEVDGIHEPNPLSVKSPLYVGMPTENRYWDKDSREMENDFLNDKTPF